MKVQASAPGKLYLAGEYAVMEAGFPALIAAIDRYLTVSLESSVQGSIYSTQQAETVKWQRNGELFCVMDEHPYALLVSAIQTAEEYVRTKGCTTKEVYAICVETQLDDNRSGLKYGLGSSGAVTVAAVRSVLAFYGLEAESYLVYQLSVIAQMRLEMTGSFGDVAASSYGGVIAYRSPDRAWLKDRLAQASLSEMLQQPWKKVIIESVKLPHDLSLLIGWTGRSASTDKLVRAAAKERIRSEKGLFYPIFLEKSKAYVEQLLAACKNQDSQQFQNGIRQGRLLLQEFSNEMGLTIETPALRRLCQIAQEEHAAAKSSGAGGGDCGICFVMSRKQTEKIYQRWEKESIFPLPFSIAKKSEPSHIGQKSEKNKVRILDPY